MKTDIIIRFTLEGFHNWPAAKDILPEVTFLSDIHRHIFHFECRKEVTHSDRDVEIILFQREVRKYLQDRYGDVCKFGSLSCEMIANELLNSFGLSYCSVLEDGENGAVAFK